MTRTLEVQIKAFYHLSVEVADDATEEQITAAVVEACPKYPDLKAGTNFDPENFEVLEDSADGCPVCHSSDTEHTPVSGCSDPMGETNEPSITVGVTRSAGSDGAVVVFVDTTFEPDASDGGPGLRIRVNDAIVLNAVGYDEAGRWQAAKGGVDYVGRTDGLMHQYVGPTLTVKVTDLADTGLVE